MLTVTPPTPQLEEPTPHPDDLRSRFSITSHTCTTRFPRQLRLIKIGF